VHVYAHLSRLRQDSPPRVILGQTVLTESLQAGKGFSAMQSFPIFFKDVLFPKGLLEKYLINRLFKADLVNG
jgi:hypothetical protein